MSKEITGTPLPSVRRMPSYLRVLDEMRKAGKEYASATDIAEVLSLTAIQVRKDLAMTPAEGRPKVGFEINELHLAIREFLGWDKTTEAFLVGAGSLGSALLGYSGFDEYGLNIAAAFDANPRLEGMEIHGKTVLGLDKLPDLVNRMGIRIAVLTVPRDAAQECADLLVKAGVKGIWNFASPHITVPAGVVVQNENIASGLAVLSVKLAKELEVP